jgi:peptide/nickel transport system substrate-binding protein
VKRIILVLIALIILVAVLLFVLVNKPSPVTPSTTPPSKIVVYAYNDRITGIDPSIEDDTGLVVLGSIYETLTYYDYKTGEVKPRLAINWTSSEDCREWIFRLRNNVVFHDGSLFNATAVKLSIERARDIYRSSGRGAGYIWDALEEVEIVDPYTVKFKLSYPQRVDILASAAYASYIFSPSAIVKSNAANYTDRKLEDWFNSGNAVGTGPYRLVSYDPMREIKLEKFNDWWGWRYINSEKAPDIVVIKIETDPSAQYSGLLSGELDIASSVPRETISDLKKQGFGIIPLQTYHNFILFYNTKRYPTNITDFRLAIAHAIDLNRVISQAVLGMGNVSSGVLPHGFPGHIEGLTYEFNLDKAREYLKRSGVSTPIKIELLYQIDYEETKKFAAIFKTLMSELGVDVELNGQDWARLKDIARGVWENPEETPHLIVADWWPTIPSPYDYLYAMFHSESKEWNYAGYENPVFDELITEAWEVEGVNYTRALELYKLAQLILHQNAVALGLWDEIRPFVYSQRVYVPEEALNPMYTFVIRFELVEVRS